MFNTMELTYQDKLTIQVALRDKAKFINEKLKEDPQDEYWILKLEEVKTAYEKFSEMQF